MWTPAHVALIKAAAAGSAASTRIFVNPAIKKALCRDAGRRPRLAQQGAAVVGPRLALPCPPRLPAGQSGMQAAAAAAGGRRLRQGARPLVHQRGGQRPAGLQPDPKPDAKPDPTPATSRPGPKNGRVAGCVPAGAAGAVGDSMPITPTTEAC